jgi:HlyD family secretion protein
MSAEVDITQLAIVRDKEAAPGLRRPRRHIVTRYFIPGALLLGFAALVAWAGRDTLSPPRDVWVVPVLAAKSSVQNEGTPLFQAAGWIEPRPTPIRVAALAPGVVERLLVVQDQEVDAGEPIAELVKDDARLAKEMAAATLKMREADLKEAEAERKAATTRFEQPVHLQALLGEADAALAQIDTELQNLPFELQTAEARLKFAQQDYDGKVAAASAVSGRAIEQAKSVLDSAQASVDGLKIRAATLAEQKKAHAVRRDALRVQLELLIDETQAKEQSIARVEAANARVSQAKVSLDEAQLRLDRMTVRAPVDGRIYQLVAFPGTTLTGGMGLATAGDSSTVATMYQPEMLQVRVDARFEDIPKVSLGQSVRINNPALSKPLSGTVLFVSSEANIQKNTLQVKVAIDSPPPVFKPEMLVDVTFLAPKLADDNSVVEETALYVPQAAIQRADRESFVWLADLSEKQARKVAVELGGPGNGGLIEVRGEGLTVGSRVIVRGIDDLDDGERIKVVSEEPAAMTAASDLADGHESMNHGVE